MGTNSVCLTCLWEDETGNTVDRSRKSKEWAKEVGVGEASIRRHWKHSSPGAEATGYSTSEDSSGKKEINWRGAEITLEDGRNYIRNSGDNPEDYDISVRSIAYGEGLWSNRISVTPKKNKPAGERSELSGVDLPTLYSEASKPVELESISPWSKPKKSLVVVWADVQVGKTGSRGGTPELIQRVSQKKDELLAYIYEQDCIDAYFLSVGDEVESFENTPQQAFTNDLSFPQQLDLELTFELDFIRTLAETHNAVTVSGVSSNHCRWRAGKNALGKPSDDYGLYLKKQLEKAMRLNPDFDHVSFEYPDDWDETTSVMVQDTKIGLAHGHQVNNPNQIGPWWQKQAFGKQATSDADILLTGHFHTFRQEYFGTRLWLQAPTLDNGSDWFRNLQGQDSNPGLLVFVIDEKGFVQRSLDIL